MSVAVLGSINMDVALSVPTIPKPGETLSASRKELFPGGKGANQAIAASRAGAETALIGALGDDAFGIDLAANLNACCVDTECVETSKNSDTGQAYINVARDGENSIIVVPGANHTFVYPLKEPRQVYNAAVRLAQLEMPIPAIRAFFLSAQKNSKVTCILNAAPALKGAQSLFVYSDIIIVNETELELFAKARFKDDASEDELVFAARSVLVKRNQKIIVTLGGRGCLLVTADYYSLIAAFATSVVDTTGAGDCFCGTLSAALASGLRLPEAIKFASAAASLAVSAKGASPSMPEQKAIYRRMKNSDIEIGGAL